MGTALQVETGLLGVAARVGDQAQAQVNAGVVRLLFQAAVQQLFRLVVLPDQHQRLGQAEPRGQTALDGGIRPLGRLAERG